MKLSRSCRWAVAGALAIMGCSGGGGGWSTQGFAAAGGKASAGAGGAGGQINVEASGGPVTVQPDGGLPALPTWHYTAPALGANPLTVSASGTIAVGSTLLGDDGVNPATGLWVKKGVTATLAPQTGTTVSLSFTDGVLVEGTVAMAPVAGSLDSTSLSLDATDVAVTGALLAQGGDAASGADGGAGGTVSASVAHDFFLTGRLVTTGGKGDNGGNGGAIEVVVSGPAAAVGVVPSTIAVTGVADNSGGEGLAGQGGSTNWNEIYGDRWGTNGACNLWSAGALRSNGGEGTAGGGAAGGVYLASCANGWAVSTGTLEALSLIHV